MPKENEPKEKALFPEAFFISDENRDRFPKIAPGFHDFLTETNPYAAEKDFKKREFKRQYYQRDNAFT